MKTQTLTLFLLVLLTAGCTKNSTEESAKESPGKDLRLEAPNGVSLSGSEASLKETIAGFYMKRNLAAPARIELKRIDYKVSPKGKAAVLAMVYFEDEHGVLRQMGIAKGGTLRKFKASGNAELQRAALDCYYMYCSGGACEMDVYEIKGELIFSCGSGSNCQIVNGLPPGADPSDPYAGDIPYATYCL